MDAYGSPTIQNDLKVFDATFGIPDPPSFELVCLAGCPTFNPRNTFLNETGWTIETTLDVEWAHAMAPGAKIVLVVAPSPASNSINTVEAAAIAQFPGSIMSQSFGIPEILVHANNAQILQAQRNYAAAQVEGISVLASAGDFGATNGFAAVNSLFPASDPLVTAVGGTQGNPYTFPASPSSCGGGPCSSGLVTFTGTCSPGPRPGFPGRAEERSPADSSGSAESSGPVSGPRWGPPDSENRRRKGRAPRTHPGRKRRATKAKPSCSRA